ncbi:MAG TPA: hypothetical protein VMX17_07380 [Candidatus Glassbacteria bacterium]|nr:hypothetical protein [Candidatus Glassbacteria bacterium]
MRDYTTPKEPIEIELKLSPQGMKVMKFIETEQAYKDFLELANEYIVEYGLNDIAKLLLENPVSLKIK